MEEIINPFGIHKFIMDCQLEVIKELERQLSERDREASLAASIGQELLKQVESLRCQLQRPSQTNDLVMNEVSPLFKRHQRARIRNASDDLLIKELQDQVYGLSEENQKLHISVRSLKADGSQSHNNTVATSKYYENVIWELEIRNQEFLEEINIIKSKQVPQQQRIQPVQAESPLSHVTTAMNTESTALFDNEQCEEEQFNIQLSLLENLESLKEEHSTLAGEKERLEAKLDEYKLLLEKAQSAIETTACVRVVDHLDHNILLNHEEFIPHADLQEELLVAEGDDISVPAPGKTETWDQKSIVWPDVSTKFDISDKIQIEILSGIWIQKENSKPRRSLFGHVKKQRRRFCWINPWKSTLYICHKNPLVRQCRIKSIKINTWCANSQDLSIEINDGDVRFCVNSIEHDAFIEILSKLVDA